METIEFFQLKTNLWQMWIDLSMGWKQGKKGHYGRMCFSRTNLEQENTNSNHHDKDHLGTQIIKKQNLKEKR